MNVLVISAHHDDLELGCGAAIAKMIDNGHKVTSLVMTHSGYNGINGEVVRHKDQAKKECLAASNILGYDLECLDRDTFDVEINDQNICRVLNVIRERKIDVLFTHWHGDSYYVHNKVYTMAKHCSRSIPIVLGFSANWYIGETVFAPSFFISVDESQWERKIKALKCYESEFKRDGDKWINYLENQTKNYGIQINEKRAEGFVAYKYNWKDL